MIKIEHEKFIVECLVFELTLCTQTRPTTESPNAASPRAGFRGWAQAFFVVQQLLQTSKRSLTTSQAKIAPAENQAKALSTKATTTRGCLLCFSFFPLTPLFFCIIVIIIVSFFFFFFSLSSFFLFLLLFFLFSSFSLFFFFYLFFLIFLKS